MDASELGSAPSMEVDWTNCAEAAEELEGNESIFDLVVQIGFEREEGDDDDDDDEASLSYDEEMARWLDLCRAVRSMPHLLELSICVTSGETTQQHYKVLGLLLEHARQIKTLCVYSSGEDVRSPVFGIIARSIMDHPELVVFRFQDFDYDYGDENLAILLVALATVKNLEAICLDPFPYWKHLEDGPVFLPMADGSYLERLFRNRSLRSVKFRWFGLGDRQLRGITSALESSDSKLRHLEFDCCQLPGTSMHSFFRSLASSSVEDLMLDDTDVGDYSEFNHSGFLGPLASAPRLKNLGLKLSLGDGQTWPGFSFLRENKVLKGLEVAVCDDESTEGDVSTFLRPNLRSLFEALRTNKSLLLLVLEGWKIRRRDGDLLAHLGVNTGLEKFCFIPCWECEGEEWPRFDFLRENETIRRLTFCARAAQPVDGFDSLCQALGMNSTLRHLDLTMCCQLEDEHADSLGQMIDANLGLEEISINENGFSRAGYFSLLPALAYNASLRTMNISQSSSSSNRISSACTAEFVERILVETDLNALTVGVCDSKHLEALVPIVARNYRIEELRFDSVCLCSYPMGTIHAITQLNKAGRCYLVDPGRGPECLAAGVNLLSKVVDDLDCLFYHIRENPLLCDRNIAMSAKNEGPLDDNLDDAVFSQAMNFKERGSSAFVDGRLDDAEGLYARALDQYGARLGSDGPQRVELVKLLSNVALVHLKQRRWLQTETFASKALAIDGNHGKSLYRRAKARLEMSRATRGGDRSRLVGAKSDLSSCYSDQESAKVDDATRKLLARVKQELTRLDAKVQATFRAGFAKAL